ncbi:LOW QUALITY PROTEIN: TATA box-binding protein-associated factor RNA polymerase I subunit B [Aphomia sociella]
MKVNPCTVCGSTDLNLVDGYYYCVECGTQDINVRETVIEDRPAFDGTMIAKKKTRVTIVKEGQTQMSGEWHKWHAYNYILAGLTDELISIGAKPTVKIKVLWLWSFYVKKYQNRKELGLPTEIPSDKDHSQDIEETIIKGSTKQRNMYLGYDISLVNTRLLLTILYLALNLDCSNIQLSHLLRFVQEGQLGLHTCTKYLPKDIDVSLIDKFKTFCVPFIPTMQLIRHQAMAYLKTLSIGPPFMQNARNLVEQYVKELCLPNDFKHLVYSLMRLVPPSKFLKVNHSDMKKTKHIPFYECKVMSYILVALKMCFGLDDVYEVKLSRLVDKINEENCHIRSYKLGESSEPSDRLFSFREWCNFLQFRKTILCKYYWPMAESQLVDAEDYVFMEQRKVKQLYRTKPTLSDEIAMNIIDNIPVEAEFEVIPKSAFPPTLTPLTTYTDVVLEYYKDPELRLLLSEDFTQYSIAYACRKLQLCTPEDCNIVVGVDHTDKEIESKIVGQLETRSYDTEMVFVRNCDNKNWMKTKRPELKHIKNANDSDNDSDRESDHDLIDHVKTEPPDIATERIDSVQNSINVSYNLQNNELLDSEIDNLSVNKTEISDADYFFNPDTFDREKTIEELILLTCKKYKIPLPKENKPSQPRKRKQKLINDEAGVTDAKKKRITKPGEVQIEVNDLLSTYYNSVHNDILNTVSQHVKSVIESLEKSEYDIVNTSTIENNQIETAGNGTIDESQIMNDTLHNEAEPDTEFNNESSVIPIETNETTNAETSGQLENNDDNVDDEILNDPKFDEEIYDIKQLYIKMAETEDNDLDNVFDIQDDADLEKILAKKIEESNDVDSKESPKNYIDSSEDELPLSIIKEQILSKKRRSEIKSMKFEYLIENRKDIESFNYWTRHYMSDCVCRLTDLQNKFNAEISENFPKSFAFIIGECASILGCSTFLLYKSLTTLELNLLPRKLNLVTKYDA